MLTLSGPDSHFEIDVVRYQFASVANDGWEPEWLEVSGCAQCRRGQWRFTDPCLTAFELGRLALWLRDLPAGGSQRELGFTEPNLRFKHVEDVTGDLLYVHFLQKFSPPWATDAERLREGYALHIPFASINFAEAAEAVEKICRKYPVRTKCGGS